MTRADFQRITLRDALTYYASKFPVWQVALWFDMDEAEVEKIVKGDTKA